MSRNHSSVSRRARSFRVHQPVRPRPVLREIGFIPLEDLKKFIDYRRGDKKRRPKSVGVLMRHATETDPSALRRLCDKWDRSNRIYTFVHIYSEDNVIEAFELVHALCASRLVRGLHVVSLLDGFLHPDTQEHMYCVDENYSADKAEFLREMERGLKLRSRRKRPTMVEPPIFVDNSDCVVRFGKPTNTARNLPHPRPQPQQGIHVVGTISEQITTISIAPNRRSHDNALNVYLEWVEPVDATPVVGPSRRFPVVRVHDVLIHMHPNSSGLFFSAMGLSMESYSQEPFAIERGTAGQRNCTVHHLECPLRMLPPVTSETRPHDWFELCPYCCPNRFCASPQ